MQKKDKDGNAKKIRQKRSKTGEGGHEEANHKQVVWFGGNFYNFDQVISFERFLDSDLFDSLPIRLLLSDSGSEVLDSEYCPNSSYNLYGGDLPQGSRRRTRRK